MVFVSNFSEGWGLAQVTVD